MINVAIVGTGNISVKHIEAFLKFPERAKIVALVDIYPEKAEEKKEKYGLTDAVVFKSHEDMLASDLKIDLMHNCTPPYVHASISIDCMRKGIDVVVEKPMASSLKECDEMLAVQKEEGVMLGVIAQNRWQDSVYRLKELASSGVAGKVRISHIDSLWWRGHNYYDLWWRGLWEKEGGGPTLNHAVHHIDMLNWIKGEMPEEVTAVMSNVMHDNSEVEDISFATLKYKDGALSSITSSVCHHGEEQGIVLQCEHAKIATPFSVKADITTDNGFPKENTELVEKITKQYESYEKLPHLSHDGQIDNILTAIETNTDPLITGEDGRMAVELITAIYKSGSRKQTVQLPLAKDDDFYTFEGILEHAVRFYEKTSFVENFTTEEITVGRNYEE